MAAYISFWTVLRGVPLWILLSNIRLELNPNPGFTPDWFRRGTDPIPVLAWQYSIISVQIRDAPCTVSEQHFLPWQSLEL